MNYLYYIIFFIPLVFLTTTLLIKIEQLCIYDFSSLSYYPKNKPFLSDAILDKSVAFHVPVTNENALVVSETIESLLRLIWKNKKIYIIFNNYKSDECIKFITDKYKKNNSIIILDYPKITGFKAGALNRALRETKEEYVSIVDADYVVKESWLIEVMGYFRDNRVKIVQSPQENRNLKTKTDTMMSLEYINFYKIGMNYTQKKDILFIHGTMIIIESDILRNLGDWNEQLICEDTEFGLRIIENDFKIIYDDRIFGKGLLPSSLLDYKKQRYRWAYGGINILKLHLFKILKLKPHQALHYFVGLSSWFLEGISEFSFYLALLWSIVYLFTKNQYLNGTYYFEYILFGMIFNMFFGIIIHRKNVKNGLIGALKSAFMSIFLQRTIALAVFHGFFTKNLPFIVTNKNKDKGIFLKKLNSIKYDLGIGCCSLVLSVLFYINNTNNITQLYFWSLYLFIQGLLKTSLIFILILE